MLSPEEARAERRRAAREAFHAVADMGGNAWVPRALENALISATQVRITPEMIIAAYDAQALHGAVIPAIKAALELAGLEVVE